MLLTEVVEPKMKGKTNLDLAEYALELRAALGEANAKIKGVNLWFVEAGSLGATN